MNLDPASHAERRLLTVAQCAERLACSQANVYVLIERGDLPVVPVGSRKGYRIDLRDIEAFIDGRKFRYAAPEPCRAPSQKLRHLRM